MSIQPQAKRLLIMIVFCSQATGFESQLVADNRIVHDTSLSRVSSSAGGSTQFQYFPAFLLEAYNSLSTDIEYPLQKKPGATPKVTQKSSSEEHTEQESTESTAYQKLLDICEELFNSPESSTLDNLGWLQNSSLVFFKALQEKKNGAEAEGLAHHLLKSMAAILHQAIRCASQSSVMASLPVGIFEKVKQDGKCSFPINAPATVQVSQLKHIPLTPSVSFSHRSLKEPLQLRTVDAKELRTMKQLLALLCITLEHGCSFAHPDILPSLSFAELFDELGLSCDTGKAALESLLTFNIPDSLKEIIKAYHGHIKD